MATYFIDIDGVILKHNTNEPIPETIDSIKQLQDSGHKIVLTTKRSKNAPEHLQPDITSKTLEDLGLKPHLIIYDLDSPRIVINDQGAYGINHPRDHPLILKHI
jgi:ribonucleotide monophosphatase NagD (HAD superfamily)